MLGMVWGFLVFFENKIIVCLLFLLSLKENRHILFPDLSQKILFLAMETHSVT